MSDISKCPVMGHGNSGRGTTNRDWWPNQLNLNILHQQSEKSNPLGADFNYAEEFAKLDLQQLKQDIFDLMKTSQDWWPADYGHYGPLFIRMAWHSAGTYRVMDGRGGGGHGNQRFAPLNSWPDNVNLDKARMLLWPLKQKYGQKISWADLIIFAGTCALEDMGLPVFGFAGGRTDIWEPQEDIYWGSEGIWLDDNRYTGDRDLEKPLAAVQMGLIYVNPEGPNGEPNVMKSAIDVRETFRRMAMNDEETVALIAGGHTFGKCHGAGPASHVGAEPEGASIEQQGLGWKNSFGTGNAGDTIGSGIEGAWTPTPTTWDNSYFETLFGYEWNLEKSPAGAWQWHPTDPEARLTVPDAHDKTKTHAPMMQTSDLTLRMDPKFAKISRDFMANPDKFAKAFARAWFKLTHRDMGPVSRYQGALVPSEILPWQDVVPKNSFAKLSDAQLADLKQLIVKSDIAIKDLVATAWASAAVFRGSDMRGGANGARLRLEPQKNWQVNNPATLQLILEKYSQIQQQFSADISMADLIVFAGNVGVELAAKAGGFDIQVPFLQGRGDASQEQTPVQIFNDLEPRNDGFRNYQAQKSAQSAEYWLVDKAQLLGLSAPQMVVLLGGMRVLDTNADGSDYGVFTDKKQVLSNDYFVNLLDLSTTWSATDESGELFVGKSRQTGESRYTATRVDLVCGSNSVLRAIAEVYASVDGQERFIKDFVSAWCKVMNNDMQL